jgi:carbohydrate-binding DOMON domain-containing protein
MATFNTAEATKQNDALLANRVQGNLATGELRFIEATYTATGTEAASGDTIDITDVPVGATVIPELCRVSNEASMGGSVIAIPKIGDAVDDDRYSATSISINSSTAGSVAVTANVTAGVLPRFVVTAATQRIKAALTRTNAMTAGKKISFLIAYRLP